jgi:hypothetical protein
MSFARAFLYAGCPSTINSLWKADDKSTSEILERFYDYLGRGFSRSESLQKAKLDFIETHPLYRDPSYWSNLILTGEGTALYRKKQPWRWAVWCIVPVIAGGMIVARKRKPSRAA